MSQSTSSKSKKKATTRGITGISVRGYKSLYEECSLEICPLTILAGANSSGKSSIMQPLLMLKQTLEATYDPGSLLLDGPNVRFTSAKQILSKLPSEKFTNTFTIKIEMGSTHAIKNTFRKQPKKGIELINMTYRTEKEEVTLSPQMTSEDIVAVLPEELNNLYKVISSQAMTEGLQWVVERTRCFFGFTLRSKGQKFLSTPFPPAGLFKTHIGKLIHVPGLRGNLERTYKTTAIGIEFPGTFENYVASVVNHWQKTKDHRLRDLGNVLETLGLTCKVDAKQLDDTQVELRVGRLPTAKGRAKDMVSIADVGFGVSQTLPVLVALLVAESGQLVYLEQPEIHLHPRAQAALAQILADAANRGVRVVVETHSQLLLLAVQSLVAEDKLSPDKVKLHWFTRRDDGVTEVSTANLDDAGAFGDWPEDFGDVSLKLESRYLDAAEKRLWQRSHGG
ncbi:MAG: AAA family ATPase [Coleofasciculaceae cyanobacterium]